MPANNSTNSSAPDMQPLAAVDFGIIITSGAFFLICLFCVILNGLLILCFWINKRESWYSHSKNILSIIIIDFLVGLTTLMNFFSSMATDVNIYECLVAMGLSLASQTATSLNVLRFCITRFYSIRQTTVRREPSASVIVIQTLIIWLLSSVIVVVPFILWSEDQLILERCVWHIMFATNEAVVDLYMVNVLTIPTLTTTVLYGILALKLRKIKTSIHPNNDQTDVPRNNRADSWSDSKTPVSMTRRNTAVEAQSTSAVLTLDNVCQDSGISSTVNDAKLDNELKDNRGSFSRQSYDKASFNTKRNSESSLLTTNENRKLSVPDRGVTPGFVNMFSNKAHDIAIFSVEQMCQNRSAMPAYVSTSQTKAQRLNDSHRKSEYALSKQTHQQFSNAFGNKLTAPAQLPIGKLNGGITSTAAVRKGNRMNKVIKTIGVLLALINISNLPYIVILAVNAVDPATEISGMVGFLSLVFLMLNSACNPIIYAVRLKPLRIAFF